VRETLLEWNDSDDPGLGYDEETGAIHLPHHHLDVDDPVPLVGGLAEELRHAWQFDVIEDPSSILWVGWQRATGRGLRWLQRG
jgi:hypothetical protein